jgi:hypothetical protein
MTDISMHIIPPAISSSIANDQFQVRAFVDWFPCIGIRHLSVLRVGWEQWCSSSDAFIPTDSAIAAAMGIACIFDADTGTFSPVPVRTVYLLL